MPSPFFSLSPGAVTLTRQPRVLHLFRISLPHSGTAQNFPIESFSFCPSWAKNDGRTLRMLMKSGRFPFFPCVLLCSQEATLPKTFPAHLFTEPLVLTPGDTQCFKQMMGTAATFNLFSYSRFPFFFLISIRLPRML